MKKYNEDYFSVREKRTGRKICDCGDFQDARMMMHMDPQNREIVKNKVLMSQVVDIEIPKSLPTNEVVAVGNSQDDILKQNKKSQLPQIKLSEAQGDPVIV